MQLKTFAIVLTVLILQACGTKKNAGTENKMLWISGYKTECNAGAGKAACLVVSSESDLAEAKWDYFFSAIEGFNFEPGFLQKIEVQVIALSANQVAADRSSLRYKLVKVLEKRKDPRLELQGDWTLTKMNDVVLKASDAMPFLQIDLFKNQVSGSDGCNSFSNIIQKVSLSSIDFGQVISTLKACKDISTATEFDQAFVTIKSYNVVDNVLYLLNEKKKVILIFNKKLIITADKRIHDIFVAEKINGEIIGRREEMPRLEINLTTMKIYGTDGCNHFNGSINNVSETEIAFSSLASTRKMCPDMILPRKFDQALEQTSSYKFENLHLTLFDKDGKAVITFLKVD